jgi:hypothetical protein
MFLSVLYVQQVLGLSPARASVLFPVFNLIVIAGPHVLRSVSSRGALLAGVAGIGAGAALLITLPADGMPVGRLLASFALMGAGLGSRRWRRRMPVPRLPIRRTREWRPGCSVPPRRSGRRWGWRSWCLWRPARTWPAWRATGRASRRLRAHGRRHGASTLLPRRALPARTAQSVGC